MVKQRFAVIGLGHFGAYVVRTLYEAGKEVLAIDMDPETVRDVAEFASEAVVADATDRQTLESIGVRDVDAAIVSLGQRLDVSTLAALHLKEMGVPYIAVKAVSEEHGRILQILGVSEVIHPEKDSATRLATRLSRAGMVDILPLLAGYSIAEIDAPAEFVGKSLAELALRNTLRVQLIAIQNRKGEERRINIVPRAEDVIEEGDLLILLGEDKDLDRVREVVKSPPRRMKV